MTSDPEAGTTGNHGHDGALGVAGADTPVPPKPPQAKPKRGRPRCAEEPCGTISMWLPDGLQDRILRLAKQRRQTPSEYLRDVMIQIFQYRG